MHFGSLFCLFSNCFKTNKVLLPEDLIFKILVEYLPDQPQNRLVSKRVRDGLDKNYKGISGNNKELWMKVKEKEMVNMNAMIKLKSGKFHGDLCEYLRDDDLNIRRMAIKLIKELKYHFALEIPVLIRLLMDSRSLDEFYTILSISNYDGFLSFKSTIAYRNLSRSDQLTLEEKRFSLFNEV